MTKEHLSKTISDILPGARLTITILPGCPDISLYLLHPQYTGHKMSKDAGARLTAEPMYWLFCWASGHALATFLLDHPHMVRGKRVLDFGCGSGVAAIAAAKAGAKKVWACDSDPCAVRATALNCGLNSVCVEVIKDIHTCRADLDIILASDILYDHDNIPLLDIFRKRTPEVLMADSRVKDVDVPFFQKIAERKSVTIPDLGENAEFGDVNIYYAGHVAFREFSNQGSRTDGSSDTPV